MDPIDITAVRKLIQFERLIDDATFSVCQFPLTFHSDLASRIEVDVDHVAAQAD